MNKASISILIDGNKKNLLRELGRVNINQFTTYYDLDHLSKEIRRVGTWRRLRFDPRT